MFLCHAKENMLLFVCLMKSSAPFGDHVTLFSGGPSCPLYYPAIHLFLHFWLDVYLWLAAMDFLECLEHLSLQKVPTQLTKAHACAPRLDSEDQARRNTLSTIVSHRTSWDLDLFETFARSKGTPLAVTDENGWSDAQLPTPRFVKDLQEASRSH